MRKQVKAILTGFLLSAICISAAACGSANEGDSSNVSEKTDVRIAYFPNITHTQALVMKNQKTLEKKWGDRCNVTWTSFNAGPAEMEAIFAGEIDLGYIGPVPAFNLFPTFPERR